MEPATIDAEFHLFDVAARDLPRWEESEDSSSGYVSNYNPDGPPALFDLPQELVCMIADQLSAVDHAALQLTSRRLYYSLPFPKLNRAESVKLLKLDANDRRASVWYCFWCNRIHPKCKSWQHPLLVGTSSIWYHDDEDRNECKVMPTFWPSINVRAVQATVYSQLFNSEQGPRLSDLSRYRVYVSEGVQTDVSTDSDREGMPIENYVRRVWTEVRRVHDRLILWQRSVLHADEDWRLIRAFLTQRQDQIICPHLSISASLEVDGVMWEIDEHARLMGRRMLQREETACDTCLTDFSAEITSAGDDRTITVDTYHVLGDAKRPFFYWSNASKSWVGRERYVDVNCPEGSIKKMWDAQYPAP